MTLLDNHLEQITLSANTIEELPFPQPKIFTNAILNSHDITALIRDTEAHERALFTLAAAEEDSCPISRRATVHTLNASTEASRRSQRQKSAVATLLGGDLREQVRKQTVKAGSERGDVDIDVLLKGAEKLCEVYPIPSAPEKINSLRGRHEQLSASIARYEARVAKQMAQLARMNKQRVSDEDEQQGTDDNDDADKDEERNVEIANMQVEETYVTEEDIRREEEEIRLLEEKKQGLEDRVIGMERDLGGLMR